jgi:hypothetical protein
MDGFDATKADGVRRSYAVSHLLSLWRCGLVYVGRRLVSRGSLRSVWLMTTQTLFSYWALMESLMAAYVGKLVDKGGYMRHGDDVYDCQHGNGMMGSGPRLRILVAWILIS